MADLWGYGKLFVVVFVFLTVIHVTSRSSTKRQCLKRKTSGCDGFTSSIWSNY